MQDEEVRVIYGTADESYEKVRSGILDNTAQLANHGFRHEWEGTFDLEDAENKRYVRGLGYKFGDGVISTGFSNRGRNFKIYINANEETASISGESVLVGDEIVNMRLMLRSLQELSDIEFAIEYKH